MAIQLRRGAYADLDKSKLVAGEVVVGLDSGRNYIGVAKAPSDVLQLATQEDLDNIISKDVKVENGILIFEASEES